MDKKKTEYQLKRTKLNFEYFKNKSGSDQIKLINFIKQSNNKEVFIVLAEE